MDGGGGRAAERPRRALRRVWSGEDSVHLGRGCGRCPAKHLRTRRRARPSRARGPRSARTGPAELRVVRAGHPGGSQTPHGGPQFRRTVGGAALRPIGGGPSGLRRRGHRSRCEASGELSAPKRPPVSPRRGRCEQFSSRANEVDSCGPEWLGSSVGSVHAGAARRDPLEPVWATA